MAEESAHAEAEAPAKSGWGKLLIIVVAVVRLEYLGYVPYDDAVSQAVRQQQPVVLAAPAAPASLALARLAERVGARPPSAPTGEMQFFPHRLKNAGGACRA